MELRRLLLGGRVQGVGYRAHCLRCAQSFAIAGSVRNLVDGKLEVYLQKNHPSLEECSALILRGPRWSQPILLEQHDADRDIELSDFRILPSEKA